MVKGNKSAACGRQTAKSDEKLSHQKEKEGEREVMSLWGGGGGVCVCVCLGGWGGGPSFQALAAFQAVCFLFLLPD